VSIDDQRDRLSSWIPFPFLREESEQPPSPARACSFYAIYVTPLQVPPRETRTRRNTLTNMTERVKRLVSDASNYSASSGLKLSDIERGAPDWG
jgi:hypothetical protein